jgi:hypothetical protein
VYTTAADKALRSSAHLEFFETLEEAEFEDYCVHVLNYTTHLYEGTALFNHRYDALTSTVVELCRTRHMGRTHTYRTYTEQLLNGGEQSIRNPYPVKDTISLAGDPGPCPVYSPWHSR